VYTTNEYFNMNSIGCEGRLARKEQARNEQRRRR
jgi:hypothetical protein